MPRCAWSFGETGGVFWKLSLSSAGKSRRLAFASLTNAAARSKRSSHSMSFGGSKVPTFKVQSKTHAAAELPRFGNSRNVEIQTNPSLGDDPLDMMFPSCSRQIKFHRHVLLARI